MWYAASRKRSRLEGLKTETLRLKIETKTQGFQYQDCCINWAILYRCKRFCHLLVPLSLWRWHLPARQYAPAHAHQTAELLLHETPKFISPDLWTPNSPDLNPANYHIWSVMQDHVYQTLIQDVGDLRQCLVDTWSGFSQSVVDDVIDEWRKRLGPEWMKRVNIFNTCCNTWTLLCRKLDTVRLCNGMSNFLCKRYYCTVNTFHKWQRGVTVNDVGLINEVNRHRARWVLRWATVFRRVNHFGMSPANSVFHPSGVGNMSTSNRHTMWCTSPIIRWRLAESYRNGDQRHPVGLGRTLPLLL